MTTVLQDQLRRLAVAAGVGGGQSGGKTVIRGKPSLLYTFQEASDIGTQDIYNVALQGLDQLCRLDPRFQAYRKTLFSAANLSFERDQQTAEVVEQLDSAISSISSILTPYFLLPACFKVLEYLIRRYNIHQYNVNDLMRLAMPYHSTPEFVKLAHILQLEGTIFEFLKPMQSSGALLPRENIVKRCLTDKSLLRFVLESGKELGSARVGARAAMPFYAALLCEVLGMADNLDDAFASFLLPYMLFGLGPDAIPDLKAATYMILVQLSTRVTMSSELANALTTEICKSTTPSGLHQALLVLSHLYLTQPHLLGFGEEAFRAIGKLPGIDSEVTSLSQVGSKTEKFLLALGRRAVDSMRDTDIGESIAENIIMSFLKDGTSAFILANHLLKLFASDNENILDKEFKRRAVNILQLLDRLHPTATEKAVNDLLQYASGHSEPRIKQRLEDLLQLAFAGSLRAPLPDAGTTLAVAIDAASASIRRLALEKLDAMADTNNEEAEEVLRGALLRRLADDDLSVVEAALDTKALLRIPPTVLLQELSGCLNLCFDKTQIKDTSKKDRSAARKVAQKVVHMLLTSFVQKYPELSDDVVEMILPATLSAPRLRGVAQEMMELGCESDHVLLSALKEAQKSIGAIQLRNKGSEPAPIRSTSKKSKAKLKNQKTRHSSDSNQSKLDVIEGGRSHHDSYHNREILKALAKRAESNDQARALLFRFCSSPYSRTKTFCLAVANLLLRSNKGEEIAMALVSRFGAHNLSKEIHEACRDDCRDSLTNINIVFDGEYGIDENSLRDIATGKILARHLEPPIMLKALQIISADALKNIGSQGLKMLFAKLAVLPQHVWKIHLQTFVAKVQNVDLFLAEIWSTPMPTKDDTDSRSQDIIKEKCAALELWTSYFVEGLTNEIGNSSVNRGIKMDVLSGHPVPFLPNLLCLMSNSSNSIRIAALESSRKLAKGINSWWEDNGKNLPKTKTILSKQVTKIFLQAIEKQRESIEKDCEAMELLLRNTFAFSVDKKKSKTTEKSQEINRGFYLNIAQDNAVEISEFLIGRLPFLHNKSGLVCVPLLMHTLGDWKEKSALFDSAVDLLINFAFEGEPLRIRRFSNRWEISALVSISELFSSETNMVSVLTSGNQETIEKVVEIIVRLLAVPAPSEMGPVRLMLLKGMTKTVFESMSMEAKRQVFVAVMKVGSQDDNIDCRSAANSILMSLPIHSDLLVPLITMDHKIEAIDTIHISKISRRKRRGIEPLSDSSHYGDWLTIAIEQSLNQGHDNPFSICVATFEFLQWKQDIKDPLSLVASVNRLLDAIVELLSKDRFIEVSQDGSKIASQIVATAAFLEELALSFLKSIADDHLQRGLNTRSEIKNNVSMGKSGSPHGKDTSLDQLEPFELDVILKCAQESPSGAVLNAALNLIESLALSAPHAVLSHVLEIISVLGSSSAASRAAMDAYSNSIASRCLTSVARAWSSASQPLENLIEFTLKSAVDAPVPYRSSLVRSLADALPNVSGLSLLIYSLLKLRSEQGNSSARNIFKNLDAEENWSADLATSLINEETNWTLRIEHLASIMQISLQHWESEDNLKLVSLITALCTKTLKHVESKSRDMVIMPADDRLQSSCEQLMKNCLLQLHHLGSFKGGKGKKAFSAFTKEMIEDIFDETYTVIDRIRCMMDPSTFISGLKGLISIDSGDGVCRRALSLLASTASDAILDNLTESEKQKFGSTCLELLLVVKELLSKFNVLSGNTKRVKDMPISVVTIQTAMGAISSLAEAFGRFHAEDCVAVVPEIIEFASSKSHTALRGSCMTTLASLVLSLDRAMIPFLPTVTTCILIAVQDSLKKIKEGDVQANENSTSKDNSEIELASALSALSALVVAMGPFLSPYLQQILAAILDPILVVEGKCNHSCWILSKKIRQDIAERIAARLLLPRLAEKISEVSGDESTPEISVALLGMLHKLIERMPVQEISMYNNDIFATLLQAFDLRRQKLLYMAVQGMEVTITDYGSMQSIENTGVASLVELTLKLSESKFKPLFFRLLEWATSTPPAKIEDSPNSLPVVTVLSGTILRRITLYNAVNELSEKLRSVFTPYFQPILDVILQTLGDKDFVPIKKKRRTKQVDQNETEGCENLPFISLARLLAIRSLNRLFVYDTSGFLDEARFDRLLPAIVEQLSLEPGASALPLMNPDSRINGRISPECENTLDIPAQATVSCLAAMALASGGTDVRWRPLNHAVLMVTRSDHVRARLAALESVMAIANALQEEYLSLIPEALPFLAELLEDEDQTVEAHAATALKRLEELSGEDLKAYLKI